MGRLFWKFFLSILLAQLAATIGIGGTFWLRDQARQRVMMPAIDTSPSAETILDAAAATLRHGGIDALRDLAEASTSHSIYILDQHDHDLLGRTVTDALKLEAESALGKGGPQAVRHLNAPDGQRFLVFVRWEGEHGPRGPGGPGGPREHGEPDAPPHDGPGGPPPERMFRPMIPMICAILASLLFAALLAWYFARPIRALRSAFEAASAGDLAPRFAGADGVRGDELSDLGRDFDRMSTQLHALMAAQRRLLHDVSHELRSPLARLQAAIGLAHQQPDKIAASLERIERESVRIDKLVGELLTLSRLDAAPPQAMDDQIEIMELIEEIAGDARFEAGQSGGRIETRGHAIVQLRGSADLLWRAIENVVRNAVKHGAPGGVVEIDLRADPDWVHIEVLDRGPGIAEADLAAVFDPFFRSAPSRNNIDGHGLGLAIAQRVIGAHGGSIRASNRAGGGLTMKIDLPLQRPDQ
ncbi:MAG: HAMP domain-containing sensor histidine kinase [Pseudomonadota bacterium]